MVKRIFTLMSIVCLVFAGCACSETDGFDVSAFELEAPKFVNNAKYDFSDASVIEFDIGSVSVSGKGASADGTSVIISEGGTYLLSGKCSNGTVTVSAGKKDDVIIALNGLELTSESNSPLVIESADSVILYIMDSTENALMDGISYSREAGSSRVDAAIFSKTDIAICGLGALSVTGSFQHGIVSKDDLIIMSGALSINAVDNGIEGKDSVRIFGGDISADCGGNGITSNNSDKDDRGYVYIAGGNLSVNAGDDGVKAVSLFDMTGGNLTVAAAHDGVHSDGAISVSGGNIAVTKSYEGLEAGEVYIAGGNLSIFATDDGINAGGGKDGSGLNEDDAFKLGAKKRVSVSGGFIEIYSDGDGIDSNGDIVFSGGTTYVSGPSDNENDALDSETGAFISGGNVLAVGCKGLSKALYSDNQCTIFTEFDKIADGKTISLIDDNEAVVMSFTPLCTYNIAVMSSPDIETGKTYRLVNSDGYVISEISIDEMNYVK